jgi:hypothetical protein
MLVFLIYFLQQTRKTWLTYDVIRLQTTDPPTLEICPESPQTCLACDPLLSTGDPVLENSKGLGFNSNITCNINRTVGSTLQGSKFQDLIPENSNHFLNAMLAVKMSPDSAFKPMAVYANFFEPKTQDRLKNTSLLPVEVEQHQQQLVNQYSAPVELLGSIPSDMKKMYNKLIEEMSTHSQYTEQATLGDISTTNFQSCGYSELFTFPFNSGQAHRATEDPRVQTTEQNLMLDPTSLGLFDYEVLSFPTVDQQVPCVTEEAEESVEQTSEPSSVNAAHCLCNQIDKPAISNDGTPESPRCNTLDKLEPQAEETSE